MSAGEAAARSPQPPPESQRQQERFQAEHAPPITVEVVQGVIRLGEDRR